MKSASLGVRLVAEWLGTAVLVATVVGSGLMASSLTDDSALVLLINALSTVSVLAVLISVLAPTSGAHFNPLVSLWFAQRRSISLRDALAYSTVQIVGALFGTVAANLMFDRSAVSMSSTERYGSGLLIGELLATAGLMFVIAMAQHLTTRPPTALLVPLWIGAAYFFTSSTSFANPAVTIGRMFSDSFTGIAPSSLPGFLIMQASGALVGGLLAMLITWPHQPDRTTEQTEIEGASRG